MKLTSKKWIKALLIVIIFAAGYFLGDAASTMAQSKNAAIDMKTFWSVWDIMDEQFVETKHKNKMGEEIATGTVSEYDNLSQEERRIYGAIKGMVDSEQDPYTAFFTPQEAKSFETEIRGSFEGIGMEVGKKDGVITVISPLAGSPAEKAGFKTGDKIVKINSTSAIDLTVDEAVKIIRGPKGTQVTIQVYREGVDKPIDIKVTRDTIQLPTLDKNYDPKTGIYTIRVYSFSEQVSSLFKQAIQEFASSNSNKLIIDLRGNPGGYLEAAVDISSYFVPNGKVVVSQDYGSKKAVEQLRSAGYTLLANKKAKVVVLVDGGSASASEIVAGALQDHKVATILGEKTFGKGSVQEYIKITAKTGLKVTIARWLTPNGNSISVSGLMPDVVVAKATSTTAADITNRTDNQYLKAVELLNK
jgi:carboxyl-terminal processing protease